MQAEKSNSNDVPSKRDIWDKINIFIKAFGILFVSGAITFYGIYSQNRRAKSQLEIAKENNREQLYAQTMNNRQSTDVSMRKGLLDILVKNYFTEQDKNKKLLILDLLSLNFKEDLHLKPLFEHFEAELSNDSSTLERLRFTAIMRKYIQTRRLVSDGASQYDICLQKNEKVSIPGTHKHGRVQLSLIEVDAFRAKLRMEIYPKDSEENIAINITEFPVTFYDTPFFDWTVFEDQRYSALLMSVILETPAKAYLRVVIYPRDYFDIQDRIRIDRLIERTSDANK